MTNVLAQILDDNRDQIVWAIRGWWQAEFIGMKMVNRFLISKLLPTFHDIPGQKKKTNKDKQWKWAFASENTLEQIRCKEWFKEVRLPDIAIWEILQDPQWTTMGSRLSPESWAWRSHTFTLSSTVGAPRAKRSVSSCSGCTAASAASRIETLKTCWLLLCPQTSSVSR